MATRFSDWASLDAAERERISAHAGEFARTLDSQLQAFVAFEDAITPAQGILNGMPYASKDMFVSSTRRPHGGLAQPLPMQSSQQAEVLNLLDRAGARRIGITAMTELA
jgi:Asp-tRNA(Asn)/Glu-tRNA(Gln) amidotransferase A subunit family amidase